MVNESVAKKGRLQVVMSHKRRANWTEGQRKARAQAIMRVLLSAPAIGDRDEIQCPHCADWVPWDCIERANGLPAVVGHCRSGCWDFRV